MVYVPIYYHGSRVVYYTGVVLVYISSRIITIIILFFVPKIVILIDKDRFTTTGTRCCTGGQTVGFFLVGTQRTSPEEK